MLRWWRTEVAGVSQRQLADRLGVARTTITNWEQGSRMASIDADRIDAVLNADGVLAGWLWCFGTPEGLKPRQVWSTTFTGGSTPVWMWIRSPAPTLRVEAEWGMYRMEGELDLGHNGHLITLGVSIEQSPVVVQLSEPGWVDFGRGETPDRVEGAPVVDALEMVMPSSAEGVFNDLLSNNIVKLGDKLKPVETLIETLDQSRHGAVGRHQPGRPVAWPALQDGEDAEDRSSYSLLREARCLSLTETSQRLADLTGTKAGRDTLRRFEANVGEPHDPLLPMALDHVLGANGHLALLQIASGRGTSTVNIPSYWTAPVWITFAAESVAGCGSKVAELQWGNWHRSIEGDLPMLVINHSAMVPLKITADDAIHWTAGIGRRRGATPINHGWNPDSLDTTQQALSTYQEILLDAVRHASEHDRL